MPSLQIFDHGATAYFGRLHFSGCNSRRQNKSAVDRASRADRSSRVAPVFPDNHRRTTGRRVHRHVCLRCSLCCRSHQPFW